MSLIKLDFGKIKWYDGREGTLYRGNSQGSFERRVLQSMVKGKNKPSYWGFEDDEQGKITFCDYFCLTSFDFAKRWATRYPSKELSKPFSHFPIIMEIDARKYKNRLYESTEGEGIVIRGPIDLDDIIILYGSHIDRLEERLGYLKEIIPPSNPLRERIVETEKRLLESICKKGEFSREDLLDRYDKQGDRIVMELCCEAYGMQSHEHTEEQKQLIKEFLKVLSGKLR